MKRLKKNKLMKLIMMILLFPIMGIMGADGGEGDPDPDPKGDEADPEKITTFTQDDLNRIAKKTKMETQDSMFKAWGVKTKEEYEEKIKTFTEWQDKQKTEAEKLSGKITEAETQRDQALSELQDMKNTMIIVEAGVPADRIPAVKGMLAVAEGDDMEAKLKNVLDANEWLLGEAKSGGIRIRKPDPSGQPSASDRMQAMADRMGVKID